MWYGNNEVTSSVLSASGTKDQSFLTPIYSSFSGFDDALELVKPLNKKLKEDALFIYNEAKGETNEWRSKEN